MTDAKEPKKSETLEIRLPHVVKRAFMERTRADGRSASEVLREHIGAFVEGSTAQRTPTRHYRPFEGNARRLGVGAGVVAALLLGIVFAISPATAQPDLAPAFTALDVNGDGLLSAAEFTEPSRALETQIGRGIALAAAAPVSIEQPAGGNYVRFMLDGGSGGSIVPLVIALDQAEGSGPARDVSQLLDQAFERLDKDGDGVLTKDEFSAR